MKTPILFQTEHRATFNEIDSYGHLNTVHYASYYLSHRFTTLRERFGLDLKAINKLEIAFYIKTLTIDFIRPVLGDQPIQIESSVTEQDVNSCVVICQMSDSSNRKLSMARFLVVCVDKKTGKSVVWPEGFMERFYE